MKVTTFVELLTFVAGSATQFVACSITRVLKLLRVNFRLSLLWCAAGCGRCTGVQDRWGKCHDRLAAPAGSPNIVSPQNSRFSRLLNHSRFSMGAGLEVGGEMSRDSQPLNLSQHYW